MGRQQNFDVIIIGAGPAGLSFARSLKDSGLQIAIVEKLPEEVLADPAEDGRDIALTHKSEQIMRDLGMWEKIPADEIGFIRKARVLNGASAFALQFDNLRSGADYLGRILPNHLIRRAAYASVQPMENVSLLAGAAVTQVQTNTTEGVVTLESGTSLHAPLVVAADSRFSQTRRMMGLSASMLDFGRVVIVCEMHHERSHDDTAYECFQYDQTLAVLPMVGLTSSVVVTLPADRADAVMAMPDTAFSADVERRFGGKLGHMELCSPRHPYPLVAVLAQHFVTRRFALIGDAAVGMHPVTAHGFNLGLASADLLAGEVTDAARNLTDIGALAGLKRYEARHRRTAVPLFHGTNALVKLFTDSSIPGRAVRGAVLRLGELLPPVKKRILQQLTRI